MTKISIPEKGIRFGETPLDTWCPHVQFGVCFECYQEVLKEETK